MSKEFSPSEELKKLQLSIASLTKADMGRPESEDNDEDDKMEQVMGAIQALGSYMNYLEQAQWKLENRLSSHGSDGHLPKLTPGALKKLIKAGGMEEDYEVAKKVIYASADKPGFAASLK